MEIPVTVLFIVDVVFPSNVYVITGGTASEPKISSAPISGEEDEPIYPGLPARTCPSISSVKPAILAAPLSIEVVMLASMCRKRGDDPLVLKYFVVRFSVIDCASREATLV